MHIARDLDDIFFSSRRRHTRCLSDWSSDVCSSDLVGTGANCRMAETHLPGRRELSGVTRDHLSQPLHSSPWGAEERAGAAFEAHTSHAPLAPSYAEDRQSR